MTDTEYQKELLALKQQMRILRELLFKRSTLMMDLVMDRLFRSFVPVPTFDERMLRIADIDFPSEDFIIIILHRRPSGQGLTVSFSPDPAECDYIGSLIISTLQDALAPEGKCYSANLHDSINTLLCLKRDTRDIGKRYRSVLDIVTAALESSAGQFPFEFITCMSSVFHGRDMIGQTYRSIYDLSIYAMINDFYPAAVLTLEAVKDRISSLPANSETRIRLFNAMQIWDFEGAKEPFLQLTLSYLAHSLTGNRSVQMFIYQYLDGAFQTMLPRIPMDIQKEIEEHIRQLYSQRRVNYLYELPADTKAIINNLFDYIQSVLAPIRSSVPEKMIHVAEYINREYADPTLSINEIAKSTGLSPSGISRQFKQCYEISPVRHLQNTRVLAAKQLLEDKELSVARIAERVGYYSASSFIHVFKKTTGMTPGEYRGSLNAENTTEVDPANIVYLTNIQS